MNLFHPALYQADLLVWMLVTRGIFLLAAAILMWREPMNCGGRNRSLHWLLSAAFFVAALNALDRAEGRAAAWVGTQQVSIPAEDLLLSESLVLTLTIALVMKLGYDYFRFREIKKIEPECKVCGQGTTDQPCPLVKFK